MEFSFFFKQKTAYYVRISDWSSDVCPSDLRKLGVGAPAGQRHRKPERLAAGRMQFAVASPAALPVARERAAPFEGAEAVAQVGGVHARCAQPEFAGRGDRKSVVSGQSVSARVDPGGRLILQKNNKLHTNE